ncbi:unnamed protein product [Dicrocoelium dendriticum]|nr:unnamed protein product [Dicrocoelium dendriticum]
MFTLSMNSGIIPAQWKEAIVMPRHKSGSLYDVKNYRPISHTSVLSKMMERHVKSKTLEFLLTRNLVNNSQHGFLNSRSCITCHLEFLNHLVSSHDRGLSAIVIYLDMQKAFDRVPHSRLLAKLQTYGIKDPLLAWFSSYLSDRSQIVQIQQHKSQPKAVTSGVVQGSVLGPLLFLLYVNDVFSVVKCGTPYLFADDIKIVYSFHPTNLSNTLMEIQLDLHELEAWCNTWKMSFNTDKCSAMLYRCNVKHNALTLDSKPLTICQTICDLGLRYSYSLNFSEQAFYATARAKQRIALLFKNLTLRDSICSMYESFARPLLEYCSMVYSNSRKHDRIAIEKVQRAFTKRLIGTSLVLPYSERCDLLKLDPIWLRRLKVNLALFFNILHKNVHTPSIDLSLMKPNGYNTRNRENSVMVRRSKTNISANFFLNRYSRIWNKLPTDIRTSTSEYNFRRKLDEYLTVSNVIMLLRCPTTIQQTYEQGPDNI